MIGTIVNTIAVIIGSAVGLVFHSRLPKRVVAIVFQAIGLFTLFIGIRMAWDTSNLLILIFSVVIGAIMGEALRLEQRLNGLVDRFKPRIGADSGNFADSGSFAESSSFGEGLITAFLLFCTGSMTILGTMQEGMGLGPDLLLAKSLLDGFASVALASALGMGVLFSAAPLFFLQATLTLSAGTIEGAMSEAMISEMTAVGGLLLMGLGITLLEIKRIKVVNMLPGLVVALILAGLFA